MHITTAEILLIILAGRIVFSMKNVKKSVFDDEEGHPAWIRWSSAGLVWSLQGLAIMSIMYTVSWVETAKEVCAKWN